ncbi:MAG: hypothetical protein ACM3PZ_00220 [Bacillota bacterium]
MKTRAIKPIFTFLLLTAVMILPYFVFAQTTTGGTINTGSQANPIQMLENVATGQSGQGGPYQAADESTLPQIVGLIVNAALGLLGIIFIILIIYAGYLWMAASGNQAAVDKAKKIITSSIIGLVIVLSSWSIWVFVLQNLISKF